MKSRWEVKQIAQRALRGGRDEDLPGLAGMAGHLRERALLSGAVDECRAYLKESDDDEGIADVVGLLFRCHREMVDLEQRDDLHRCRSCNELFSACRCARVPVEAR